MKKWIFVILFFLPMLGSTTSFAAEALTPKASSHQTDVNNLDQPKVNINKADAELLADRLTGIGMAKAQAIVAYRDQHGPFAGVEALLVIKGIGPAILEKNQDRLKF